MSSCCNEYVQLTQLYRFTLTSCGTKRGQHQSVMHQRQRQRQRTTHLHRGKKKKKRAKGFAGDVKIARNYPSYDREGKQGKNGVSTARRLLSACPESLAQYEVISADVSCTNCYVLRSSVVYPRCLFHRKSYSDHSYRGGRIAIYTEPAWKYRSACAEHSGQKVLPAVVGRL